MNWKPFYFEGNLAWGQIENAEDWERIKKAYKEDVTSLRGARRFDDALSGDYFGFAGECRGSETLGEFFTKHGMNF